MRVAIDKFCVEAIKNIDILKNYDYDFIYLFDDEKYKDLLKLDLHCIYYKNCDYVDINLTKYKINCLKKCSIKDKNWNILPQYIKNKIGIIVPNYNYEHTIEKCLNSILDQTYKNFEIIFVDDVSTDRSVQIVKEICCKNKLTTQNIKIVQLKQKRYNGGARNEAYLHLSDDVDYVWYVDSDDWLYDKYVLEDINKSLQNKPDVLFVGMADYKNDKLTTCYIPEYKNKYDAFEGWSGSCGKVIKTELATRQDCLYNEGTLKEDKNQHCKICFYMNSFELLKRPVYVWNRQNYKSVTTKRENIMWQTSTIRHYADAKQFALTIKGQDVLFDYLMEKRLEMCKNEMLDGGDRQW